MKVYIHLGEIYCAQIVFNKIEVVTKYKNPNTLKVTESK